MSLFPIISPTADVPATVVNAASIHHRISGTSYNFASTNIGAADVSRRLVIGVLGWGGTGNSFTVSGVDVGGGAASAIAGTRQRVASTSESGSEFWQYSLAAGTSVDITPTFAATMDGMGLVVFSLYDAAGTENDVAVASGDTVSGAIDCPANGVIMGVVWSNTASAPSSVWTNLTKYTDTKIDVTYNHLITSASDAFATLQTARSISCDVTPNPTSDYQSLSLVSYGPA